MKDWDTRIVRFKTPFDAMWNNCIIVCLPIWAYLLVIRTIDESGNAMIDPAEADGQDPNFDVPVVNVTATSTTTAILPCTINFVGDHKVIWMDPRKKVLTLADTRIIQDQRVSVERPYTKDWNLHIRTVRMNDSGEYQCQINTEPVKSKKIILIVNEAPMVLEDAGDQVVKEGDTVLLSCRVTGTPYPKVTWYRRYVYDQHTAKEVIGGDGEQLKIYNVSRYCEDDYECVADNGIEPGASRKMRVTVQFPPEVELLTNRLGQMKRKETILDCKITANPHGYIVWKKGDKEISNSGKYGITIYEDDRYAKTLSLRIGDLNDNDFGRYTCYAQNAFGSDQLGMTLYELVDKRRPTTTTTTTTLRPWLIETVPYDTNIPYSHNDRHKYPKPSWTNQKASQGTAVAARSCATRLVNSFTYCVATCLTMLIYILCVRR